MKLKTFMVVVISLLLLAGNLWALDLGSNITIYDNRSSSQTGWYGQQEDQEVEPNMVANQNWDLEGFFLNGTTLYVVGGFDFKNGYGTRNIRTSDGEFRSGDIFIDTNGDAVYGRDLNSGESFGYDYVLDLDFETMKYNVYSLPSDWNSYVSVYYTQNVDESNPWRYSSGGTLISSNNVFSFWSGLDDNDVAGLLGGNSSHYAFAVDLGFLNGIDQFTAHFTIECGNDNLMGRYEGGGFSNVVPEPSTVLLLGLGLLGLGGISRKKFHKK